MVYYAGAYEEANDDETVIHVAACCLDIAATIPATMLLLLEEGSFLLSLR